MGIKPPSIYKHINGNDELRRAVAIAGLCRLTVYLNGQIRGVENHQDLIRAIAFGIRQFFHEYPALHAVITATPIENDSDYEAAKQAFILGAGLFLVIVRTRSQSEKRNLAISLIITALIYVGFAVAGNAAPAWLAIEAVGVAIYTGLAGLGWRYSKVWLAAGWLAHPLWDTGLHLVENQVKLVLIWYALACTSFDLLVALYGSS
ncbi:DUF6010 family protein [Almyronema epifaneia S1]|uniref:DUF6010 family protein n=1 Tax=Almyronema epifaneia S1 TaxID=2991925 RepID=A0ABW6IJY4_9CYAN